MGAVAAGFYADRDEHMAAAADGILGNAQLRRTPSRRTGADKAMNEFLAAEKVTAVSYSIS